MEGSLAEASQGKRKDQASTHRLRMEDREDERHGMARDRNREVDEQELATRMLAEEQLGLYLL